MLIRDATYEQAVLAWTTHLRAGGTTDWSAWRDTRTDQPEGADRPRVLPDAIHLELIRRINLATRGAPVTFVVWPTWCSRPPRPVAA